VIKLVGPTQRAYAKAQIDKAPDGYVVTIREPTRTLDQNAKLWAVLTDLSQQKPEGITATREEWKCLAMNACGWETQFMLGLDGRPFPVGFSSSRLTIAQMSDLIEFCHEYGARHGVTFTEPDRE
jgi:hypothetical protein